jgi:hypothetical protein
MNICPNCQHEELPGALFCGNCGAKLPDVPGITTQNIEHAHTNRLSEPSFPPRTDVPPPTSSGAAVSLYVIDSGQMIPLSGREEFTLGRAAEGQPILPDIDLTPYRAYEYGVSRLHTSIKFRTGQITVTDLGSINGTRVNGQKIVPHKPVAVAHGDILTLGKLKLQLVTRR